MNEPALLPPNFWGFVFIFLIVVFICVMVSLVKTQAKGWGSLVSRYPARTRPAGKSYRIGYWTYCNAYCITRGLRFIFSDAGIYFYMQFPHRLTHRPFLIPWESIKIIRKKRKIFGEYSVLEMGDDAVKLQLSLDRELWHILAKYKTTA
jgi:hypothetical protein